MTTNDMVIRFRVDGAGKVRQEVNGITQELGKTSGAAANVASAAKGMIAQFIGAAVIYKTIRSVTTAVLEQEKAVTALNASLTNTGIYSAQFSQAIQDNASALQKLTIYGDEAILSGTALMQNIGNMSADVLPKAQKAVLGLAAGTGMSLETAFMMMGKAAAGNTALLGKYGIVIDETLSQTEKFAKVLEIGAGKFGLAEAAAKTTAGQLEQLKNAVGDMYEIVGGLLLPVIKGLVAILKPFVSIMGNISPAVHALNLTIAVTIALMLKWKAAQMAFFVQNGIVITGLAAFKASVIAAALAVKGFMVSIGPVGWALLGIGAAMTVFSLASKKSAENMDNMGDAIASVRSESIQSISQFDALAEKYLKLRQKTQLTKNETIQLKNVINSLRTQYGAYLGDLDLERGKYEDVAAAIGNTRTALEGLIQRRVQEAIVRQYAQEIAQAEREKSRLDKKYTEAWEKLKNWPEGQDYKVFTETTQRAMDQAQAGIRAQIDIIDNLTNEMQAALQKGITLPPVTITDDSNSNNGSTGKTKDDPLAEEKRRAAELIKTFSDRRKEIEKIYAQDKLILADYVKDKEERDVYLTNLEKKYNADVAALKEEELRINFDKIQKMFKYNELMGVKNQEYYDNLKQLKADEIALYQFDAEKTAALIKKANDEIDKERMEFVRGDALLAELRQFGMSQAETYQAQYDEQKARLQKAVDDQKAIIAEYQKSGLVNEKEAAAMVANLTSGLSKAFAAMSAELAKNLESLKEKTQEAAASVNPFDSWLETMTPIYDSIETLTANVVNAFGQMITEGKSFGDAMKDAFKSWVGSAISEIARLMARMVALYLMKLAFNSLTGGLPETVTSPASARGISEGLANMISGGGLLGGNTGFISPTPVVSPDNGLNTLVTEVQGLRRDVYAAQQMPTITRINWPRGTMSRAVETDALYRMQLGNT